MKDLDVDEAIGFVNKIIDNVRCATCEKLEGTRARYQCGHVACDDCIIYAQECQICTPPSQRSDVQPKHDEQLTNTVKSAVGLQKACHKLFDANAFQRKRISEQLKIEKELFPNCIQAPIKYENKRKSSLKIYEKSCSTYFPGEEVVPVVDMANTTNYVHQWLRNNEKNLARKPFSDLNVNTSWANTPKNKKIKHNIGDNICLDANRKRMHSKTTDECFRKRSIKSVYKHDNTHKKVKNKNSLCINNNNTNVLKQCDNDESGIFMENEPIVIHDTQESVIDKDKNAWLLVLKACQNEDLENTSKINISSNNFTSDSNTPSPNFNVTKIEEISVRKVPYFKRSAIIETCKYCKNEENSCKPMPVQNEIKPVKITIDGDRFITTISVFTNIESNVKINTKSTVAAQTDICETGSIYKPKYEESNKYVNKSFGLNENLNTCVDDMHRENLFADDRKVAKCLVIQESDSDTDLDVSGPMSVKADVHRSCEELEYGILNSVFNVKKHESKPRRRPRGYTPTSTDSSEKENYNPNRIKRCITGKKKYTKK